MRILVVGAGGREHTLAWKLAPSAEPGGLFVAPGNGGTATTAQNVSIPVTDIPALVEFAQNEKIDLTVIGPEAPLVDGLVDAFAAAGLRAFGPTAAAARLEGSKSYAKRFLVEEGIPTAVGAVFTDYEVAAGHLRSQNMPIVIKASGLAAGKGVFVCATRNEAEMALKTIMLDRAFGAAGDEVLIEDCLIGEEVSVLAFSDGTTVVPMLPARDYKRVRDGDAGPNTGGMGCYAPSPYVTPDVVGEVQRRILQPAVDGMRRRGTPYVGVLYAGLMLTSEGPRVLEFNCRFGDPETQVLLPLLETDLAEICDACIDGRLRETEIHWKSDHCVAVVLASGGYPGPYEKGKPIVGIESAEANEDVSVFQAGTQLIDGQLITSGGRVLAVAATAPSRSQARDKAYQALKGIRFEDAQHRSDIALVSDVLAQLATTPTDSDVGTGAAPLARCSSAYADAGVDISAGSRAVELMLDAVKTTYTRAVLAGVGAFGGLYSASELCAAKDPVLVASTDGVGTKTMIAEQMGVYDTVGQDIVNHCLNDTLVQGAHPLFFFDYFASGKIVPEHVAAVVGGCAKACREIGCALLGGETAEMPGVYKPGTFDLVGTMVSWVERDQIIDGSRVRAGDICIGLPSSGLHTNGYSLARHIFADVGWNTVLPELGRPLGEVLLDPHRAYLGEVEALWEAGIDILAMAHITGGGFIENIPRVLPDGIGMTVDTAAWEMPPIFQLIQKMGNVSYNEMYRVLNTGIGLVVIVGASQAAAALRALQGKTHPSGQAVVIGETRAWDGNMPRVQI